MRLSCLIVTSAGDISPTLEIDVLEYKDEYVLPTGYGATIICRSNCPKLRCSMYEKPYQITLLFNGTLAKSCSGGNPQKTCSYFIHNTAEGNSGDYTCKTYNQYGCTMDTLRLVFKGKLTAALSYDPTVQLLQKCYRLKQLGRERAPLKPQKAYKKCEKNLQKSAKVAFFEKGQKALKTSHYQHLFCGQQYQ